jgi:uncharacterized integral membrane protein (TIGR00697 family)
MRNELILIVTLLLEFSGVVISYTLFRKAGLFFWTVLATIAANIEVLILVHAFGMDMTLGNILFASTFLVTDILSELYGKKAANMAVKLGIATSICFVAISSSWLLYLPSEQDTMWPAIHAVFSGTPRVMLASLAVYVIVQFFDVWLYHAWWKFTERKSGSRDRFLFVRNNGSTLVSQFLNTVLYTAFAFAGVYDWNTLVSIAISSYVIFIFTSLADTPFIYLCRAISRRFPKKEQV